MTVLDRLIVGDYFRAEHFPLWLVVRLLGDWEREQPGVAG